MYKNCQMYINIDVAKDIWEYIKIIYKFVKYIKKQVEM